MLNYLSLPPFLPPFLLSETQRLTSTGESINSIKTTITFFSFMFVSAQSFLLFVLFKICKQNEALIYLRTKYLPCKQLPRKHV